MNVVILVPRRADGGHRDRLWVWCRAEWENRHPGWLIVEGEHVDGPFNRSAAVNAAARAAGDDWDVALIIDADVISDPSAVNEAVNVAATTGKLVVAHDERIMLNKRGTTEVMRGHKGSWRARQFVDTVWSDSVSCAVAVPRGLWDQVGGMDELFVGWGREDTAFRIACEVYSGPILRVSGETFHLWHQPAPEVAQDHPLRVANEQRHQAYVAARWNREAVEQLTGEAASANLGATRIPRILHRTLPETVDPAVEARWDAFRRLHPGWQFRTWREPLNPRDWPRIGKHLARCETGAQRGGLVRLECLLREGGVYVDADVVPHRSFEPLLHLPAFAGWEDSQCVPDAVLGAEAGHPAWEAMLAEAVQLVDARKGAWESGPGVTTRNLPGRADVLVLPPAAFYPVHYLELGGMDEAVADPHPSTFATHLYLHSWGTEKERENLRSKQRPWRRPA